MAELSKLPFRFRAKVGVAVVCGAVALAVATLPGCYDDDCAAKLRCEPGVGSGGQGGAGVGGGGLLVDGDVCDGSGTCGSGHCVDGVCCAAACDGVCESCNLSGAEGSCTPVPVGTDPADECGLASCDGVGACAFGQHLWSKVFNGDTGPNIISDIAVDSEGNAYLVGTFAGTLTFGTTVLVSAGGDDVFVAKLDPNGSSIWAKRFGDAEGQSGGRIAVTPDGGVVVGARFCGSLSFGGELFSQDCSGPLSGPVHVAARLDNQGAHVWSVSVASNVLVPDIHVDAAGNAYLVVSSLLGVSSLVRKLNGTGATVWDYSVPSTGTAYFWALAVTSIGEVWAAGSFTGTAIFSGNDERTAVGSNLMLVHISVGGTLVSVDDFSNGAVSNTLSSLSLTSQDAPVIIGSIDTSMNFGGGDVIGGGGTDVFVAWFDANGEHQYSTAFGGPGSDSTRAASVGPDDSLSVVGTSEGAIDFGSGPLSGPGQSDVFVAKFSADGAHQWSRLFGTRGDDDAANALAVGPDGTHLFGGSFDGPIDFGGGPLQTIIDRDLLVAALGP